MKKLLTTITFILLASFVFAQGGVYSGYYESTFGKLAIVEESNEANTSKSETILYGDYKNVGTILSTSVQFFTIKSAKFKGVFVNGKSKGSFEWFINKQYSLPSFTGKWGWGNNLDKGEWNGEIKNYNKKVDDIKKAQWSGNWNTNLGKLFLRQNGNEVTGDLGNTGTITGTVSGNKLKGVFKQGNRNGTFELKIRGNKFSGSFDGGKSNYNKWNGTKKYKTNAEVETKATSKIETTTTTSTSQNTNKPKELRYRLILDKVYQLSVDDPEGGLYSGYELFGIAWCRAYDYTGKQIQPFDVTYSDKYGRFWEIKPENHIKTSDVFDDYTINKKITFDFPVNPNQTLNETLRKSKIQLTVELKDYDKINSNDILGKETIIISLDEAGIKKTAEGVLPNPNDKGIINIKHGKGHIMVAYYIEQL